MAFCLAFASDQHIAFSDTGSRRCVSGTVGLISVTVDINVHNNLANFKHIRTFLSVDVTTIFTHGMIHIEIHVLGRLVKQPANGILIQTL